MDKNECLDNTHNCTSEGMVCKNSVGSFNCDCEKTYFYDSHQNTCVKLGCRQYHKCKENSVCEIDENGDPGCACPDGYELDGKYRCRDINECLNALSGEDVCEATEECRNLPGSFECEKISVDVTESTENYDKCSDENTSCSLAGTRKCKLNDSESGFVCRCKSGFIGEFCDEIDPELTTLPKTTVSTTSEPVFIETGVPKEIEIAGSFGIADLLTENGKFSEFFCIGVDKAVRENHKKDERLNSTDALACSVKWAVLVGLLAVLIMAILCCIGVKCKSKDDRNLYDGNYTGGMRYGPSSRY